MNVYEETQQRLKDADTGKQDVQMQGEKPPQVMQTGSTVQSGEEKPFEKGPAPGPGNELDNYARSFFKKISKIIGQRPCSSAFAGIFYGQ